MTLFCWFGSVGIIYLLVFGMVWDEMFLVTMQCGEVGICTALIDGGVTCGNVFVGGRQKMCVFGLDLSGILG